MSYDPHDPCLLLGILRWPSIPTSSTSQAHNFFDMDPFLARVLPTERYQSPHSVGGALVSNRRVFKNLRGFYENGSDIFARALVDVLRYDCKSSAVIPSKASTHAPRTLSKEAGIKKRRAAGAKKHCGEARASRSHFSFI